MFAKGSRYENVPIASVPAPHGGAAEVAVVKLRPLESPGADPVTVRSHDQLDAMSEAQYGDATRYWHIADANSELEAAELTRQPGRTILVSQN
jgi:nucleoid-associated protein YgaU